MEARFGNIEDNDSWFLIVSGKPQEVTRLYKHIRDMEEKEKSKTVTFKPTAHPHPTIQVRSRKYGGRKNQRWTQAEFNTLYFMLKKKKYSVARCAKNLERTKASIRTQMNLKGWSA